MNWNPFDFDATVGELINMINENGWHMQKVKSYYKFRICGELVITVFTKQKIFGGYLKNALLKITLF